MKCLSFLIGFAALAGTCLGQSSPGAALLVLHPSASGALRQVGTSTIRVPTHAIYVNSNSSSAVTTQGNVLLDTPELRVVGNIASGSNVTCTGQIICGGTGYADPFANMALPNGAGMPNFGTVSLSGNNSTTIFLDPGFYNGISVTGNRTVHLRSGTYVIGSGGFRITAGNITGYNVTLVMLQGQFDVSGTSSFILNPPGVGPLGFITVCQPASNTNEMRLTGGSQMEIQGGIYAPGALLRLNGTAAANVNGPLMGDIVVASQVELTGTSEIRIGRANLQAVVLPKMPLFD